MAQGSKSRGWRCDVGESQSVGSGPDQVNRPVWARDARRFLRRSGWTDLGERTALGLVADEARGRRVLDVGVGAGRTTWFLRLLTDQYHAVDYTPEMVALALEQHPGLDIREGDARDLSDFGDESFDLVVFSNNGLDALNHPDRAQALGELARVLQPGGRLFYSTLNLDGPARRDRPWRRSRMTGEGRAHAMGMIAVRAAGEVRDGGLSHRNWRRVDRFTDVHSDWALAPLSAHRFGLLVHYQTLSRVSQELTDAGLVREFVLDIAGAPLSAGSGTSAVPWFHVIARKARVDPS